MALLKINVCTKKICEFDRYFAQSFFVNLAVGGLLGITFGSSQSLGSHIIFVLLILITLLISLLFHRIWPLFLIGSASLYFFITSTEFSYIAFSQKKSVCEENVIAEGIIDARPEFFSHKTQITLKNVFVWCDNHWNELKGKTLVTIKKNYLESGHQEFFVGDTVRFMGYVSVPQEVQNESQFDYKRYLQLQKILFSGYVSKPSQFTVIHRDSQSLLSIINQIEYKINQKIYSSYPKAAAGFMLAFITGQKGFLEDVLKESFNQLGITHSLVISGLHIGIIWGTIFFFVRIFSFFIPMTLPIPTLSAMISIPFLVIYVAMSGFQIAAMRALIICICLLAGAITQRNTKSFHNLCIAFVIITVYDPLSFFQTSFLLSFISIIILLMVMKFLSDVRDTSFLSLQERPAWYRYIVSMIIISFAMWPLNVLVFGYIPYASIIANLIILPILSFVILPCGLVILAVQMAVEAKFISFHWGQLLDALIYMVEKAASLSSIYYTSYPFYISFMLASSVIFLFLYHENFKRYISIQCILCIGMFAPEIMSEKLQISFHAVGQGDAATIITPQKHAIVIDGGGIAHSVFDPGKTILIPFLHKKGVDIIDLMIMSHSDYDHLHGLVSLAQSFDVHELWLGPVDDENKNEVEILKRHVKQKRGKIFELSSVPLYKEIDNLQFYSLDLASVQDESLSLNNRSLVTAVNYQQNMFLFTGDIEREREEKLIHYLSQHCMILFGSCNLPYPVSSLKVAHHGSKTSSTIPFISVIQPQYAIISSGRHNRFGFPHSAVLDALKQYPVQIYQTSINGQISFIENDDNTFSLKTTIDKQNHYTQEKLIW